MPRGSRGRPAPKRGTEEPQHVQGEAVLFSGFLVPFFNAYLADSGPAVSDPADTVPVSATIFSVKREDSAHRSADDEDDADAAFVAEPKQEISFEVDEESWRLELSGGNDSSEEDVGQPSYGTSKYDPAEEQSGPGQKRAKHQAIKKVKKARVVATPGTENLLRLQRKSQGASFSDVNVGASTSKAPVRPGPPIDPATIDHPDQPAATTQAMITHLRKGTPAQAVKTAQALAKEFARESGGEDSDVLEDPSFGRRRPRSSKVNRNGKRRTALGHRNLAKEIRDCLGAYPEFAVLLRYLDLRIEELKSSQSASKSSNTVAFDGLKKDLHQISVDVKAVKDYAAKAAKDESDLSKKLALAKAIGVPWKDVSTVRTRCKDGELFIRISQYVLYHVPALPKFVHNFCKQLFHPDLMGHFFVKETG